MNGNKLIIFILVVALIFSGCAQSRVLSGTQYEPYGVINRKDEKKENVVYERKKSSVVLSVLFFETIVVPIVLMGFHLYEPYTLKKSEKETEKEAEK